jgi:hypothetical protein
LGPTYWETEAEAESAADDVVALCEELKSALEANGYCGATVIVGPMRVYQWTAFFFDPPKTVWSLVPQFAEVRAGCCGREEGAQIGPKWPNTNFQNISDYPFGSINPCVDDGSNVTCTECSGCEDDPCCTFHPGQTCAEGPCFACEDCAAKLNAGEYALDIEYPDMTIPPPDGDIRYGGFYSLLEVGCGIKIYAWASCDNLNAPEGPYFQCGCNKTYDWAIGCDEEGGPVITGSSEGDWGSCGCNSDGGSFGEGPGNPLLCNPRNVTAPKPTVSIRKIDNELP